jgi:hypothetical protein
LGLCARMAETGTCYKGMFRPTSSAETRSASILERRGTKQSWPVLRYDRCMSGAAEENHHNSVISTYKLATCRVVKSANLYIEIFCVVRVKAHLGIFVFSSSLLPHLGACSRFLEHRAEFSQFLNQGQSVGLLGRVISSSQGLYLHTNTEKRTHIHKH